ncbi:MAG: prepilin peptidase [Coriobacteriales bacterium]|nr:prepilin peptidase [Coriobacteriales bacterium]
MNPKKQRFNIQQIFIIVLVSVLLDVLMTVFSAFEWASLKYLLLIPILVFVAAYDFKFRIIPNWLILAGLILWILCISGDFAYYYLSEDQVCLIQTVKGAYMQTPQEIALCGFLSSICCTTFCALVAWLTGKITRQSAFGMGDIKMIFMLCLFFDIRLGAVLIILACIVGLVFMLIAKFASKKQYENSIPFGFALALAALVLIIV